MKKERRIKKRIKMYSALEVANLCGVVNQTAINWIRCGYLKAFSTPGGQYRIYHDDLVNFLNSRGMRVPDDMLSDEDVPSVVTTNSILIINDNEELTQAIDDFLLQNAKTLVLHKSKDGFDAGLQLTKFRPRIVILDFDLKSIKGADICRQLKSDAAFALPYIIVLSSDGKLESEMRALGVDAFFKKPVEVSQILTQIMSAAYSTR